MSNIDHQAIDWVARQAHGPLGPLEQSELNAWLSASPRHQGSYLRARAIDHTLRRVLLPEGLLQPHPPSAPPSESVGRFHRTGRVAMLAGVTVAAFAVGVAYWISVSGTQLTTLPMASVPLPTRVLVLETAVRELRKVPLSDGSLASLDSATRLEIRIDATQRHIQMQRGQAWFQVASDTTRPFVVTAGNVNVMAVGTAFAVQRQAGGTKVVVTEGVVHVTRVAEQIPVRIAAGQQAFIPEQRGAVAVRYQTVADTRQLAWREGVIVLKNDTLAQAAEQFNRYNRRQVVIADPTLRDRTFVGRYRVDEAEQFSNDVRALLKVPVRVTAEQIRIGDKLTDK